MDETSRHKIKTRAKRIAGQVAGIQGMIKEDRYRVNVLNQIAAARSALDALGLELFSSHSETCVLGHGTETAHKGTQPMTREQLLGEVRAMLSNFLSRVLLLLLRRRRDRQNRLQEGRGARADAGLHVHLDQHGL
jgi:DNA-binding FrmR family transcriptional regulator